MVITKHKERNKWNELLVIAIKLLIYIILFYFNIEQPVFYQKAPFLKSLGYSMLIFSGASLTISIIRLLFIAYYIKRNRLKSNIRDNFILGINRIVSVLNTVFFIIAFMKFLGLEPRDFLTSITLVAAAIALIFKDYINNMINGLIIMFSDRLSLGDHIRIHDQEGKILDITLLNIILQNEDNDMVVIPNSMAFSSTVINQSKQDVKKLNLEFELDLALGYVPASLESILIKQLIPFEDILVPNGFSIKTLDIKKETVRFKLQVLLNYNDRAKERELRRNINSTVLQLAAKK